MAFLDDIRHYWDDDAPTYDASHQHRPTSPMVLAAWAAALEAVLPPAPARILDCGAGTGFLSLLAARLGHDVTALDLSPAMLDRLKSNADAAGVTIGTVVGPATDPPDGEFDAVMERHLLWTLPDPAAALRAWREVGDGRARLVLVESLWGDVDPIERCRARVRRTLDRVRATPPEHHAEYAADVRSSLPLGRGTHPAHLAQLARDAGWRTPRLRRLADVEWAERAALPLAARIVGVSPRFVIVAD